MIQYLKEHGNKAIQEAIGRFVDKYSLPKGELPALSSALSAKFGNNTAYGDVITTANYEYTVIYRGVEDFDIIEYHKINKTIHEQYDRKRGQIPNAINQLSGGNEITKGEYNSNSYNASDREADGNYAGLDQEAPQGESQQTQSDVSGQEHQGGSELVKTNFNGTNAPRYMHFENTDTRKDWNSALSDTEQQFTTSQGEVYAFAAPNGNLYFDETVISSEHPIHEYTHLWDRVVAKNNPQLWQRGITLMKETSLWKEVEDESNEIPALFYFFKKSTNILFLIIRHLTAYSFSQERRKNNSYYKVTKKFTIFAENKRYEKKTG